MTAIQSRLRRSYWRISVTMITFLVGAWLVVSAYALGNQRYGTPWTITTTNDCGVGIGIMCVSLVGLILFTSSLLGTLRAAGFLRPSPRPQAALAPGPGYAPPASPYRDGYERTMAMLKVAASRRDWPGREHLGALYGQTIRPTCGHEGAILP
jgi:hypothetical protein